jgi:hypothetical protein
MAQLQRKTIAKWGVVQKVLAPGYTERRQSRALAKGFGVRHSLTKFPPVWDPMPYREDELTADSSSAPVLRCSSCLPKTASELARRSSEKRLGRPANVQHR